MLLINLRRSITIFFFKNYNFHLQYTFSNLFSVKISKHVQPTQFVFVLKDINSLLLDRSFYKHDTLNLLINNSILLSV